MLGVVNIRVLYPGPTVVPPPTAARLRDARFEATSKLFAFVVVAGPTEEVVLFPWLATATSSGFTLSKPLYSAIRTWGLLGAEVNATDTTLYGPAEAMFFA